MESIPFNHKYSASIKDSITLPLHFAWIRKNIIVVHINLQYAISWCSILTCWENRYFRKAKSYAWGNTHFSKGKQNCLNNLLWLRLTVRVKILKSSWANVLSVLWFTWKYFETILKAIISQIVRMHKKINIFTNLYWLKSISVKFRPKQIVASLTVKYMIVGEAVNVGDFDTSEVVVGHYCIARRKREW